MQLRISIRGHVRPSIHPSVRPSVCPVLFSNDEKRPFRCSDDDEIWHAPRDSQGQFKNDIKMTVRRSVHPSKTKNKRKWTISDDKVVASFEPRGSCYLFDGKSRSSIILSLIIFKFWMIIRLSSYLFVFQPNLFDFFRISFRKKNRISFGKFSDIFGNFSEKLWVNCSFGHFKTCCDLPIQT